MPKPLGQYLVWINLQNQFHVKSAIGVLNVSVDYCLNKWSLSIITRFRLITQWEKMSVNRVRLLPP